MCIFREPKISFRKSFQFLGVEAIKKNLDVEEVNLFLLFHMRPSCCFPFYQTKRTNEVRKWIYPERKTELEAVREEGD